MFVYKFLLVDCLTDWLTDSLVYVSGPRIPFEVHLSQGPRIVFVESIHATVNLTASLSEGLCKFFREYVVESTFSVTYVSPIKNLSR